MDEDVINDPEWWDIRAKEIAAEREQLKHLRDEIDARLDVLLSARTRAVRRSYYLRNIKGGVHTGKDSLWVESCDLAPYIERWMSEFGTNAQVTLAKKAKVNSKTIRNICNGGTAHTSLYVADALLTAMGYTNVLWEEILVVEQNHPRI